jgi:hypothetical protein
MATFNDLFKTLQHKRGDLMSPFNGDFYGPEKDGGERDVYNILDLVPLLANAIAIAMGDLGGGGTGDGDNAIPAIAFYKFAINENGVLELIKPGTSAYNPWFFIGEDGVLNFKEPYDGFLKAGQLELKGDGQLYYRMEAAA